MKQIYQNAILTLKRRAKTCWNASQKENTMVDCGWSNKRYKASWKQSYYEAVSQIEKIEQRISK